MTWDWPLPCISAGINYECLSFYMLSEILSATDILISSLATLSVKIDDMNTNMESLISKTPQPQAASILCSEYYSRQDLDGDGLICGIDFYISTDRPKILDSVPKIGTPITWTEYQNSHGDLF